ncbi:hypothetical protein ACIBSW_31855 [Actinoplanes sp. NPDC049668]|uniref:hypothetical protein n=1 Tax=unclassified Actinoplanes TaxID=2626549 RepID=UPI0033B0F360
MIDNAAFDAARRRATARDGVLTGQYVLVDGELLAQAYGCWEPDGVHVVVNADSPGAVQDRPGRWIVQVPHERIAMSVSFTTQARHRAGGMLELTARDGDAVRATWWRGPNHSDSRSIPDGFMWEKNDDYYYGTVGWGDLDDLTVSVEVHSSDRT